MMTEYRKNNLEKKISEVIISKNKSRENKNSKIEISKKPLSGKKNSRKSIISKKPVLEKKKEGVRFCSYENLFSRLQVFLI